MIYSNFIGSDTGHICTGWWEFTLLPVSLMFFTWGCSAVRPVISASSDWGKIFSGDSITLTCNADSDQESHHMDYYYHWYKDKDWKQSGPSFTIDNAGSWNSGDYTCGLSNRARSDPFTLKVTYGEFSSLAQDMIPISATPPVVYEGDSPSLRCHLRKGFTAVNTIFYKQDKKIPQSETDSVLQLTNVATADSSRYSCSKQFRRENSDTYSRDTAEITVRGKLVYGSFFEDLCFSRLFGLDSHSFWHEQQDLAFFLCYRCYFYDTTRPSIYRTFTVTVNLGV
uniref:Ig-like domain-containing protein n=1 Tax=Leptobrachium leishanense TaxID=445787 RepID=A0A8C5MUX6_9ANUR